MVKLIEFRVTLKRRWEVFKQCLQLFSAREKRIVMVIALIQMSLTILDVIAVALISLLGALAVTGIQSQSPGTRVTKFLEIVGLEEIEFQSQVALLAVAAASLLVIKTLTNVYFFRKQVFFLSRITARVSKETISKVLSAGGELIRKRSVFDYSFAISAGVSAIVNGVIGTGITLMVDIALLISLSISLLVVDIVLGITVLGIFGISSVFIYRLQSQKAREFGHQAYKANIYGEKLLNSALIMHKELSAKARLGFFEDRLHRNRDEISSVQANLSFMPSLPRYILDLVLVVGGVVITATQFKIHDSRTAFATLSVFLVASSRMLPALIRIQQGVVVFRSSVATAFPILALTDDLVSIRKKNFILKGIERQHPGFEGDIFIQGLSFSYERSKEVISDLSMKIPKDSFAAIVGPSGAGKTTIVDLILGTLNANSGKIEVSGLNPTEACEKFPGAIAYLPQEVQVMEGTLRENIALGFDLKEVDEEWIWESLSHAQLDEFVRELPLGLETMIGERGYGLSGGQKQRLGLARAFLTRPKLLILDEATSSLDAETERAVTNTLTRMKGAMTLIVIAHRLSTIRNADVIFYIKNGQVLGSGSFDSLRKALPNFDKEADLLGIVSK